MQHIFEKIMQTHLLPFFNHITTVETFIDYCLTHNHLVHHEDLLRYLAMKKVDEKTAFYLSKIKERLQHQAYCKIATNFTTRSDFFMVQEKLLNYYFLYGLLIVCLDLE